MATWFELKLTVKDELEEALRAFSDQKGWVFFIRLWPKKKSTDLLLYFKRTPQAHRAKEELLTFLSQTSQWGLKAGKPKWHLKRSEEKGWFRQSKKEFVPKKISRHLVVKPTWQKYQSRSWETVVQIDPQMAFGTGHHFTTRFCLQMLDKWGKVAKSVMDVGCGSGILAIAAAKLGATHVHGIDNDPLAVKTARRNAKKNKVPAHFTTADLATFKLKPCELVLANLTSGLLLQHRRKIFSFVKPKGLLIVTGVMRQEKFLRTFQSPRFQLVDQRHSRLWSGYVFKGSGLHISQNVGNFT